MPKPLATLLRHIRQVVSGDRSGETSDGELLERVARQRDSAAFAALVQRHGPMVMGVCRRVLGEAHDAEDAFQASFLVLFRKAGSLSRSATVAGWLYTVASHVALRAKAMAGRRRECEMLAMQTKNSATTDAAAWDDLRPVLDEELGRLPEKYRLPIVLCYLEGRTNQEAAQQLGWPKGTVDGRLSRAREVLRQRLARRGLTLSAGVLATVVTENGRAAVPSALADALISATGLNATGGAASAAVVALSEGALRALWIAKLKTAATLIAACLVLAGSGWFFRETLVATLGAVFAGTEPAQTNAVSVSFGSNGLASIRWGQEEWLDSNTPERYFAPPGEALRSPDDTVPAIPTILFERTTLDGKGQRQYQFEKVAVAARNVAFDPETRTRKQDYPWGGLDVQYEPGPDRLDLAVTLRNASQQTIADFALPILPLVISRCPDAWDGPHPPTSSSFDDLAPLQADVSEGRLFLANLNPDPPCRYGLVMAQGEDRQRWSVLLRGGVAATEPGKYWLEPHGTPRVPPGKALTLKITLRFTPTGTETLKALPDAFQNFRDHHPFVNNWGDRRPIGMLFRSNNALNSRNNPRGWLNDPTIDVMSPEGKTGFRAKMLQDAQTAVRVIKATGGQGMILWDVEGTEQPIGYIGDPQLASRLAPEMDEVADDYFKVFRDAGLRTGVHLRPSQAYFDEDQKAWSRGTGSDGGPGRSFYAQLRPKDIPWNRFYPVAERLSDRIAYCKKRWGCTLFFVGRNGTQRPFGEDEKMQWLLVEAAIWKKVKQDHPDVLIVPELQSDEQTFHTAGWAYTARYMELRKNETGTSPYVRDRVPGAFSLINIGDADMDSSRETLKAAVASGDILLFRGWFDDRNNAKAKALYDEAKGR
jgi:RNA polymerase sigma factor (sigma-70 family)